MLDIMGYLLSEEKLYPIPFYQEAKLKWFLHLIYCFILVLFLAFIFIPGNDQEKIILNIFFLLVVAFFLSAWLLIGFFKRPFIKITDENLEYKALFSHQVINLKDISHVEHFYANRVHHLGIRTYSEWQGKRSFWKALDRSLGYGFTVTIPVATFSNIDFDKLTTTIVNYSKVNTPV